MKINNLQPPRAQTNLNPKTQKSILRDPQLSSKARFCPPGSGLSPFSKQKKKVSLKQLPPYIIGTNKEDVQQFKTGSLIHGQRYRSRGEAQMAVFDYIEIFYNRQRLHSSLDYQTPEAFERAA